MSAPPSPVSLSTQDVADRIGRALDPAEAIQVQAWIADVLAQAAHLVRRPLDPAALPPVVRAVLLRAVVRCVYNPAGLRSYNAGSVGYTAADAAANGAGGPVLTDADATALGKAYGRTGLGQVRTPPTLPPGRAAWWPTDPPPYPPPSAATGEELP